jgi:PEGA domain
MKRSIICIPALVMTFILSGITCGQTSSTMRIEGKPEILPSELIDKNIRDVNGETCAAIKIISNLDGLTFNSNNGIIKSTGKPGEVMNEIGVSLQSGVMWKIEITGKEILIPINIIVDQKDADISIDGTVQEKGKNTFNIEKGKHPISILKPGYKPVNSEIDVNAEKTLFQYNMVKLIPVLVSIKSSPGDATIFWNNKERDKKTNTQFFEMPGKYKIRLVKYGYLAEESEVEVKEKGKNDFSYTLNKNSSELTISIEPSDAELNIDDKTYKAGVIDIEPGRHVVQLSKNMYATVFDTLDLKLGQKLERKYSLEKNTGILSLKVNPAEANVYLDDQRLPDYSNLELTEGTHLLRIEAAGYETETETIKPETGQKIEKKIELIPQYGKLQLTVSPVEAEVDLIKGNTSIKKFSGSQLIDSLLAVEYKIEVRMKNFIPQTVAVLIQKDQTSAVEVNLKQGIITDLVINSISAESQLLNNLKLSRENDLYIVNYDLPGKESDDCEITLFLMDKANPDFSYEIKSANGDIGKGKYYGINKTIKWNWVRDFKGGIDNNNLYLFLKYEKSGGGIPWYVWAGGAIAGGVVGVLASGKKGGGGTSSTVAIPTPPVRPGN